MTEVQAHISISLTEGILNKFFGHTDLNCGTSLSFHQNRLNESKDEYSSQVVPQQKYKSTYILPVHIIHNTKCFIQKQTFDEFFKNNIETTFHHSVKSKVYPKAANCSFYWTALKRINIFDLKSAAEVRH